jgi:hypothetical protein
VSVSYGGMATLLMSRSWITIRKWVTYD